MVNFFLLALKQSKYHVYSQVDEENVGVVMDALAHRKGEVVDMGAVPGNFGRTRMSLTCPSRLVNLLFILYDPDFGSAFFVF